MRQTVFLTLVATLLVGIFCFAAPDPAHAATPIVPRPPGTLEMKPPAAPGNLTVQVNAQKQVELAWQDNAGNETGYKIERRDANGQYGEIASVAAGVTKFTDSKVQPGSLYTYRVKAFIVYIGAERSSAYSNEAAVTIPKSFTRVNFDAGHLALTGKSFTPVNFDAGHLALTGKSFTSVNFDAGNLTLTGKSFTPVNFDAGHLALTGKSFTPVNFDAGHLTLTGKSFTHQDPNK